MTTLEDLQVSIKDKGGFTVLEHYYQLTLAYLRLLQQLQPTSIYAPNRPHYRFFQYSQEYGHRITRPLNTNLFIMDAQTFHNSYSRLGNVLNDIRIYQGNLVEHGYLVDYLQSREMSKVFYTMQQSIGAIGDSFHSPNQARKRIGQLFENLILLLFQEVGLICETKTIQVPVPSQPGYTMSYQLDLIISRGQAVIPQSSPQLIQPNEVIGSVKTTSKDRIDKIFLDKFMLSRLLGIDIPFVAIFLHDVQRAKRGSSIFGINSTFKTNHFLGYTVALNRLDGVYYIDLAPELMQNALLSSEIRDFQQLITKDIWMLTKT